MNLTEKLNSLLPENIVPELSGMLNNAQFSFSWWGERLVSVEGYEGAVTVNAIALTYLKAKPFRAHDSSLQERVACDRLWDRVVQLYVETDRELQKAVLFYRVFVFTREINPLGELVYNPRTVLEEEHTFAPREFLCKFTQEKFRELFPGKEPIRFNIDKSYCYASREMLEAALN